MKTSDTIFVVSYMTLEFIKSLNHTHLRQSMKLSGPKKYLERSNEV